MMSLDGADTESDNEAPETVVPDWQDVRPRKRPRFEGTGPGLSFQVSPEDDLPLFFFRKTFPMQAFQVDVWMRQINLYACQSEAERDITQEHARSACWEKVSITELHNFHLVSMERRWTNQMIQKTLPEALCLV